MTIAIVTHGGAWYIAPEERDAHKAGCQKAVLSGFQILMSGGSALDAVEAAIAYMEDDPTFDAGIGSHLNRDGVVQLDAGIMDGKTYQVGAVAAVERIKNPIKAGRYLLNSEHNMLVGVGGSELMRACGFPLCEAEDLVVPREHQRWTEWQEQGAPPAERVFSGSQGTVGAVAIDRNGYIAAGTSTGGTPFKPPGRVGDSPLPGCGYYADNALGGASVTGHGESIIRVQLARTAVDFCSKLHAQAAAQAAIHMLSDRVRGKGGVILIDHSGRVGFAYNTPQMARAYIIEGMQEPEVSV